MNTLRNILTALCVLAWTTPGSAAPARVKTQPELDADALFASSFTIDDRDPERGIPSEEARNQKPIDFGNYLMALAGKAEDATTQGDHLGAAKFYRTLAKVVPDRAVSFVKLCASYEAAGERENAEQACGDALSRDGVTVADFVHYVRLVLSQAKPLSQAQMAGIDAALAHLGSAESTLTLGAELGCDVGMRLNDEKRLARCVSTLHQHAPNDLKTISYEWAYALRRGDLDAATRATERAKQLGMKAAGVTKMEATIRAATPSRWRALLEKPLIGVFSIAGVAALAIVAAALLLRKRRALRQVARQVSA